MQKRGPWVYTIPARGVQNIPPPPIPEKCPLGKKWGEGGGDIIVWGPKRTHKAKNRTNGTKEFSEQFEGVTGHYTVKEGS